MHGAAVRTNVNLIGKNLEITTVTGRYRSGRFDIKPAFLIGGRLIGTSLLIHILPKECDKSKKILLD